MYTPYNSLKSLVKDLATAVLVHPTGPRNVNRTVLAG